MIRMSTAVAGSVWTRQVGLKGIFQFWINILHACVYLMTLVHQKNIKKPKTSRDFLVQVPKTLHSEAHSDYIFDIPAISLGEILGSLGLGNNIDLSLGLMGKNPVFFQKQNRYQIGNHINKNKKTWHKIWFILFLKTPVRFIWGFVVLFPPSKALIKAI